VLEFLDTSAPTIAVDKTLATSPPEAEVTRPPVDASATAEEFPPVEESAPVEGLLTQEFVPPKDTYRSHPELTQDFVEHGVERAQPEPDQLEVETAAEVQLQSSGASEFWVPNAAEDFMDAASAAVSARPADVPAASPPPPELPTAPALDLDLELSRPAPEPAARQAYSVRETKGQSVASFFAAMLRSRPAGAASVGDTSAGNSLGAPSAPEGPPAASGASGASGDAAVSFDDLFGAPEPSSKATGSGDPSKEDLDQFQSWLQNLKR
jgi:hypothetical protein